MQPRIVLQKGSSQIHVESALNSKKHGLWTNRSQQRRKFFDELAKKVGVNSLDDWYDKLSLRTMKENAGRSASPSILMSTYPEHNWIPWKFKMVPYGFWLSQENQRKYVEWLGKEIVGVKQPDDWYSKITRKLLEDNYGSGLLHKFNGSPATIIMNTYPDHNWLPWKFNTAPIGFWKSIHNQRIYFDWLGTQLGVNEIDDWYEKISKKVIEDHHGGMICKLYNSSMISALQVMYPDHKWIAWKFKHTTVPHGYWNDVTNQRAFFDELGKLIGIQSLDDWYQKLSDKIVRENGGQGITIQYSQGQLSSAVSAIIKAYPEHNWIPWKFNQIPKRFWKSKENQKHYFDWLGKELGVNHLDDWYHKLSYKCILSNYGTSFLEYEESPLSVLMSIYPQHKWIIWKFTIVPTGFWKSKENQRKYFDWLGNEIGIKELDDWYEKLSENLIRENFGASMLAWHKNSPVAALMSAYPHHDWFPWKFNNIPHGFWKSNNNISKFLSHLSEKLSIQTLDDWYRVDIALLQHFGASSLISKFNGLYGLLKYQYPNHPWDFRKFQQRGKKAQRWLVVILKKIFPKEEIIEDFMHPKAVFTASNRPMQLDVFIPSRLLAFEYQGHQHYQEVGLFGTSKTYQQRDQEKRCLCASNSIKLVEVPYWWNRTQESLEKFIFNSK